MSVLFFEDGGGRWAKEVVTRSYNFLFGITMGNLQIS